MAEQHWCVFKHIPSQIDGEQLAANIEKFLKSKNFDKNGIKKCGENGNDSIEFSLRRDAADRLRDNLKVILPNINSPIWFGILTDPLHNIHIFDTKLAMKCSSNHAHQGSKFKVLCQFGSLRSYNLFYSHTSLNNQMVIAEFKSSSKVHDSLHLTFEDIQITIPFHSIQKKNILINKINEQTAGVLILISLQYAPSIYQLMEVKSDDGGFKKGEKKPVRICVDNKEYCSYIDDIANSCDIVFQFRPSENAPWTFLRHFLADRPYRYEINFSTFQIADWTNKTNHKNRPNPFNFDHASYKDRYALSMLTSLGYVFRDKWAQLTDKELKWNEWSVEERYDLCCFAVEQLTNDHGYDLTRTKLDYQIRKSREKEERDKDRFDSDKKLLRIALCTLTPLTTIFRPFEMSIGSRALRNIKFGGPEQFLLVHFRDEDNTRLFQINSNIKKRLKYSMSNGIIFMDKKFIFMGSSVGQMKEQAFWYVSLPSTIKDMNEAYEHLGQFQKIKNIATYIARIGQYFSRTLPIGIRLKEVKSAQDIKSNNSRNYVLRIPDIEKGPYCFTDGVGKVSLGLAGRVAQKMNLPLSRKEDIPSAYQIRVAGCKGMLAIDPESTLDDYYIHVRDSMIKFESNDWDLEICDYARPMTLSLNNQVIRLLKDLGTHDGAFIGLQNITVAQLEVPERQQLSGIDIAGQKSFAYASSKENLLTNRIPIPPSDGRNMFGVADETGVLKYGECFIQYSVLDSSYTDQQEFKVVTGRVIVTKNPCLWPGDVRVLTAVANNKLARCMRDVIVFPTTGNRPHSNEMAGSDLDGDQYWVYWGNELKVTKCVEPLSYQGAEKASAPMINHEIIIQHIVESFSAGIMTGVIANAHSVVADKHPEHSLADDCKKLAELFSLAVDSPKTGKFIDKAQIAPYRHKYCSAYPTFLRKYEQNSYESSEILGILYRKALDIWTKNATTIQIKRPCFETKTPVTLKDIDKEFEKWLKQDTWKEVSKTNDQPGLINSSNTTSTSNNSLRTGAGVVRKPFKNPNRPPVPLRLTQSDSNILVNSKAEESTDSTLPSLVTAAASQNYFNFLIANNTIRSNSDIMFDRAMPERYNVRAKNNSTDVYDRNSIIKKIIKFLDDVPGLSDKNNQSVELTIYFGYINFIEQPSFPKKYGDLKTLVSDKADQIIHFSYGNPTKMNILKHKFTKMKKNQIEYEFTCQLITDSTKYYTLLFSKSKHLEQIRVSQIYSKNYIRLPNLLLDNLYELRNVTIHNSDSMEFRTISNFIFKETPSDLLNDAQPITQINQNVLRFSVVPISLKIIDEEQMMPLMESTQEPRFRNIGYLLFNSEHNHVKILNTMEYRIHPIPKNKDILKEICDEVISTIEPAAFSSQKYKISLNKTKSMSNV